METELEIIQEEGNSFLIKKEDKVIGKMMLDNEYRHLAKLFGVAPELRQIADGFRDYLGDGKHLTETIDEVFEMIKENGSQD